MSFPASISSTQPESPGIRSSIVCDNYDYFDLNDILASEEKIKVRFNKNSLWSTYFTDGEYDHHNKGMTSLHIGEGTIFDVPLWLGIACSKTIDSSLSILPPPQYGVRVRSDIKADPVALNLRDLSRYWYRLGMKIGIIFPEDSLSSLLSTAFGGRLSFITRSLFTSGPGVIVTAGGADPHHTVFGVSGPTAILDHDELLLYRKTSASKKDSDAWISKSNTILRPLNIFEE